MKLHIGGTQPHPDWKILDIEARPEVDFIGDAAHLDQFEDNSLEAIYVSHVLEHFHHSLNHEVLNTLKEWHRVLEPGGKLYISVPDLQVVCWLYLNPNLTPPERHFITKIIYGSHSNQYDVHKAGFDFGILAMYLEEAGFEEYEQVSEFFWFNDCSRMRIFETLISLNVIAQKSE